MLVNMMRHVSFPVKGTDQFHLSHLYSRSFPAVVLGLLSVAEGAGGFRLLEPHEEPGVQLMEAVLTLALILAAYGRRSRQEDRWF